jgi:hypothetical protein
MDHFGYFAEQSLKERSKTGPELSREYFSSRYSDPDEARYKMDRFVSAMTYLDQHWEDFNVGNIAVVGKERSLPSRHLAIALYRFYSHAPDETLEGDPPPAAFILEMARQSEHSNKHGI